jgi:LuxR family transcriptional regulator, maltose regulon positive regulatory protein
MIAAGATSMVPFPHKIVVPQRPPHLVSRPRLTSVLCQGAERRLLTLCAPAGYGKTSALIDFASAASLPVCWYSLDQFDADPWVFVSYLAASLRQRFPAALAQTQTLLAQASQTGATGLRSVIGMLLQEIDALNTPFSLVLDDWHLVDRAEEISDLVAQLVTRCANPHLIIASRHYPGLPDLMLLAARRQMTGLDEERLRFTPPEVAAVISAEYAIDVAAEQAHALAEQANGWITGILLALQANNANLERVMRDGVADRQVYRFLNEQVFTRLPADLQQFILDSALLDEVSAAHCDAVFGRHDSRQLIEQLTQQHLFISEVRQGVWRYHPLFCEFLQEHYRKERPQEFRTTTRRIADDYAARGQWSEAFDCCMAAEDLEAAQAIVARGGQQLYMRGRLETLERCFAVLPLDNLDAPLLCLKGRVQLDRGHAREAQVLADLAARRAHPDEIAEVLLLQAIVERNLGNYDTAIAAAQQVMQQKHTPAQEAEGLRVLAFCHYDQGRIETSLEELLAALRIEQQRGDMYTTAKIYISLGMTYEALGQLERAEEYYTRSEAYWSASGDIGRRALTLNNKGVVQHLMGNYQIALMTLSAAQKQARSAVTPRYEAVAFLSVGDLYSDLERWNDSSTSYGQARSLNSDTFLSSYLDLAEIRLLVRQRRYLAAMQQLDRLSGTVTAHHPLLVLLLQSSITIGLGDETEAAQFAQHAITTATQNNAPLDEGRAYLLNAHVAARFGDDDAVRAALAQVDAIAEQLGHDAFLVAEALHAPALMRRAQALGWRRCQDWAARHAQMRRLARNLHQTAPRPLLVVRTFGTEQLLLEDQPVEVGWARAREVLYYLLAHPRGASPDELREAIWPELELTKARANLKAAIYELRSSLPRDLIVLQGRQLYRLERDVVELDYDVEQFLQLLDAGDDESCFAAFALYSGPFLQHSDNEWSAALRTECEQRYLQALRRVAASASQRRAFGDALLLYRRLLALDPLDEAAHAGVMRCQLALGNRAAAIAQYRQLRELLADELGLDPEASSEAEQLYQDILDAS